MTVVHLFVYFWEIFKKMSDLKDDTLHDDLLFQMLTECKTLPVFLDHIFGFLSRRTDFYHVSNDVRSPVGMPDGFAERIVRQSFYKWKCQQIDTQNIEPTPPVIEEVEIGGEEIVEACENLTVQESKVINNVEFTTAESYNGAIYDHYCWSQTILEVDIFVKIPPKTTTKDLLIRIETNHLSVKLKNNNETLIDGELREKCKHHEAIWSINNNKLEIHLDKIKEFWWDCLLITEPKLDLSKIDCSRPFDELSEEAQTKINELQWNQERKRLGLPTSDELKMQKILKQAWNAEGSPFSGPYDPNIVKFN